MNICLNISKFIEGYIQRKARSRTSNHIYASMCNGLTKSQLQKEKAALECQLKDVFLKLTASARAEVQQKLSLVNKELESRSNGFLSNIEELCQQLQKEYAGKSTSTLQSELASLYQQREAESLKAETKRTKV